MGDKKYSIDDILREAARIKSGGNFDYDKKSSANENSNDDVKKSSVSHSVTVPTPRAGGGKRETIVKVIRNGAEQPVTRRNTAKPLFSKDEDVKEYTPASLLPKDIIDEISEKRQVYAVKMAMPSDNAKKDAASFSTPDANAQAQTRIINSNELKQMTSATNDGENKKTVKISYDKTMVLDPRELKVKQEFDAIKKVEQVNTSANMGNTDSFPAIGHADYSKSFSTVESTAQAIKRKENEKTRKMDPHFIKSAVNGKRQNPNEELFSKTPPQTIERPAVMRGKTMFEKTADLQAIPEIMSVDDFQKSSEFNAGVRTAASYEGEEYNDDGQIKLDGFDSDIDVVPTIDESDAEEQLYHRRKSKIESFPMNNSNLSDAQKNKSAEDDGHNFREKLDDYNTPADKASIRENLFTKKRQLSIKAVIAAIITAISVIISIFEATNSLPSVFADPYSIIGIQYSLLAIMIILNISTIKNGLVSLFKFKPDSDFPIFIATLIVIGQAVYSFISPDIVNGALPIYASALVFAFLCNNLGKRALVKRILTNFEFIINDDDKYTVENITDEKDTADICRGMLMGDPVVQHSVKTKFPSGFLKIAYAQEPSDLLCKRLAPFTVLIYICAGVACYLLTKDIAKSITTAACCACIGIPVVSLLSSNTALLNISSRIAKKGAMINGFEGAEKIGDSNAIICDAADLFPKGSCNLHGIKTFGGMKMDEAILHTASVIISSNGPLKNVFDNVIGGKTSILPEADTIVYEDRMGTSAWIYGKKVLVGNRELMLQHGVKTPGTEFEGKYKRDNRCVLYLAIAGTISAMFVVSYSALPDIKQELHRLEKSGLTVLVRTSDPNITEEMLDAQYDLVDGFVRVLGASSGRVFEKYNDICTDESPAYCVHSGKAEALISAMSASDKLTSLKSILSIIQVFAVVLGLAMTAVLSVYDSLGQLTSLSIILYQLVWSAILLLIAKLGK